MNSLSGVIELAEDLYIKSMYLMLKPFFNVMETAKN